jgi:hypothetical protein
LFSGWDHFVSSRQFLLLRWNFLTAEKRIKEKPCAKSSGKTADESQESTF